MKARELKIHTREVSVEELGLYAALSEPHIPQTANLQPTTLSDPFTPALFAHNSRGSPPSPAAPPRLPRGNPLGASRIEVRCDAEVEGCTKNSVGEWDRGELARLERGVGSMRLKLMQQVPESPNLRVGRDFPHCACDVRSWARAGVIAE
jgi:hypothetical protein